AMAICAAHSIANFAEKRGIDIENIMPNMLESDLFPTVAADVAMQAIKEGVALQNLTWEEVYRTAKKEIDETHALIQMMEKEGFIPEFPEAIVRTIVQQVCEEVRA
ncbi:MAG: hypothetical protein RR034_08520, partial [Bacteroidales bacterium]